MRIALIVFIFVSCASAFAQYSRDERSHYSRGRQRGNFGHVNTRISLDSLVDEAAGILERAIANKRDRRFRPMLRGLRSAVVRQAPDELFAIACDYPYTRASMDPHDRVHIEICPAFYQDPHDYQLTVLLHEAFHAAGNPGARREDIERNASRAAQDVREAAGMDPGLDS